ncbi:MAG: anhydro-N-acetylmuramic acid kinase [Saprospiraceae bacterium]
MAESVTYKVLGLMSGSSLDGLDLAFCEFQLENDEITNWQLLAGETLSFTEQWQNRLRHLPEQSAYTFAQTDTYFGLYMGELVKQFLIKHQLRPDFISSHGHTVFHHPERRFTTQIGSGAALAGFTGYPVVSDFRSQDVAQGGEGAPIAPIADKLLFSGYDFYLNLGGIANISANIGEKQVAFDIGGANQILNMLAMEAGLEYDRNGQIAANGELNLALKQTVDNLPYFNSPYPKTLDNRWVMAHIAPPYQNTEIPLKDRLFTACIQLAEQINLSIQQILTKENLQADSYQMLVTGGGAFNAFLMQTIQNACPAVEIVIPDENLIAFKEAILMALMGLLRVTNQNNCLRTVTGAKRDTVSGAIYQGWKRTI